MPLGDLFAGYRSQAYEQDERLPAAEGVSYGGWSRSLFTRLVRFHTGLDALRG